MARLVGTSVFIEIERRGGNLSDLEVFVAGNPVALASITASELLIGAYRSAPDQKRQWRLEFIEAILSRVPVIALDRETAETHAKLSVDRMASGRQIGPNDLIIAATVMTHGYALVTHNLRHFRRVPGLEVLAANW